jgi:transposase
MSAASCGARRTRCTGSGSPGSCAPPRAPKGRDGVVEAIRVLTGDGRSARSERTQAINQARALILTGPDELRSRFAGHLAAALAAGITALRPRPGDAAQYAVRIALRSWAGAWSSPMPDRAAGRADRPARHRPRAGLAQPLRRRPGHRRPAADRRGGPSGAAAQRGGLGAHVRRRPDPGIIGETRRHRLNRGGNREASHALWRIVITRMSARPATRANAGRRTEEGLSRKEIIRCLKRYVARAPGAAWR